MKKEVLIIFSIIPLMIGFILEFLMIRFDFYGVGVSLIGLALLIGWFFVGKNSMKYSNKTFESIFFGNILGFFSLAVILLSLFLKGQYPTGIIGRIAQNYFLPIIGLTARLDIMNIFKSVTSLICAGFSLMIIAYYLGLRKKLDAR